MKDGKSIRVTATLMLQRELEIPAIQITHGCSDPRKLYIDTIRREMWEKVYADLKEPLLHARTVIKMAKFQNEFDRTELMKSVEQVLKMLAVPKIDSPAIVS